MQKNTKLSNIFSRKWLTNFNIVAHLKSVNTQVRLHAFSYRIAMSFVVTYEHATIIM